MSNYKPILGFPYDDNVGYEANLPAQEDDILNKVRAGAPVEMDTFKEVHDEIEIIKSKIDSISESGLTTGADVEQEINNAKDEIKEEIGDVKEELEGKIDSAKTEVMASVSGVDSKVDTLASSVTTSIEEVKGSLNTSITTLSGTIKTEISTAKAEVETELNDVKDELDGKIGDNNKQIEELTKTLNTKVSHEQLKKRIEDLVGSAPEALDTLEEIANKLNGNGDAIETINGVLSGKVNQTEYDEKVTAIEEAVNGKQDKGDYVEYSDYQERKTIQLKNYDSISGLKTDGGGVNLAMVSKWNVADFGSTQLPINLNGSEDHPTYNDKKKIALVDDIPNLDGFATEEWVEAKNYLTEHQSLTEYAKTTEVDKKIEDVKEEVEKTYQVKGDYVEWLKDGSRNHLRLANHDNIDALNSKGDDAANLVMLSQWDVAYFGSIKYPINLNGSEDAPTYNDKKKIALQEWVKDQNYLTEHQSLDEYATKEDLNTKANAADVYTKTEIDEKGYLTEHQNLDEYAKTVDVEAKYQEKGDYVVWSQDTNNNKKAITLKNHDSLVGTSTTGDGANLAMLSKWDVADFGSVKYPINLNGLKPRPTYNDDKEIALLEDVPSVENFITKDEVATSYQPKGEYPQWSEDIANEKKTILMDNNDSISGRLKSGIGANLVMLSKWDVADFGSKSAHINLNGKFECPTYNDKDKIVVMKESGSEPGKFVLTLENADLIMGKTNQEELENKVDVKQGAVTIAQVNKWNVVDLGSPKTLTNINVKDGERVTVQEASQSGQEAHKIAYLSDIDNLKTELIKHFDLLLKNYQLKSDDDIAKVINAGGDVVVAKDVKSTAGYTLTKNTNIDLNGYSLDAVSNGNYGDNIVVGNGANVTISNGEIKPAENASVANASGTILIKTASESHLTLNNVKATGIYPVYLNSANENSTVTINGGEFYTTMPLEGVSSDKMAPAVYVGKGSSSSVIGGKVTINGGTFGQKGVVNNFLLNVEDVLRKQEDKEPRNFIEVFGGNKPKFLNFDPSNNKAEGEGTNFVAEGCHVEKEIDGDDVIYTVVND